MTARTHDLAAFTTLGIAVLAVPLPPLRLSTVLLALLANQIGGIMPDIDQPTAPLWRNLPIGKFIGRMVDRGFGGHRFITHSLLGLALFGFIMRALLGYLTPILHGANTGYIWWAFMLGMGSHLVMDTFTKEGVPWLLPLPFKFGLPPLKSLRITTGKVVELGIVFPGLIIIDIWLAMSHSNYLVHLLHAVH